MIIKETDKKPEVKVGSIIKFDKATILIAKDEDEDEFPYLLVELPSCNVVNKFRVLSAIKDSIGFGNIVRISNEVVIEF